MKVIGTNFKCPIVGWASEARDSLLLWDNDKTSSRVSVWDHDSDPTLGPI